jgi:RNA polymerase sigma-70 factor (ECF subfamily)
VDHPDEQTWVRQAQTGDRSAFAALVERYWTGVYSWLHGMTQRSHTAEDLTQEVFLKAWTMLPSLQAGASFRPWLYRISRNCLIDSGRGSRGMRLQPLPSMAVTSEPGPVENVLAEEGQALLQAACARLPDTFRAPFLLWTQQDMPYAEIAQILSITEETARWRVCKARHLLLQQLKGYLDKQTT